MADTLFSEAPDRSQQPLAERLRPRNIDEVIGQQHLLGVGKRVAGGVRIRRAALHDPVGPARWWARPRWRG
ncbi:hypothetical protein ACU4GD_29310 [Cupriavidus basilensis]